MDHNQTKEEIVRDSRWSRVKEVVVSYSEISTLAGVVYIFMKDQTILGMVYWISWFILLMTLGTYWSIQAYVNWKSSPVMTTAASTAVPLAQMRFPGIVFCTEGLPVAAFRASFYKQLQDIVESNNLHKYKYTPIETQDLTLKSKNDEISLSDKDLANMNFGWDGLFINGSNVLDFVQKGLNTTVDNSSPDPLNMNFNALMTAFSYFLYYDLEQYMTVQNYLVSAQFAGNSSISIFSFFFDPVARQNLFNKCGKSCVVGGPDFYLPFLNLYIIFESLLSNLWYSRMPCFDIQNVTAINENEGSFVKTCLWKGIQISCSAIFTTIPTDTGMCCSFNMNSANDIFTESIYSKTITRLQNRDKANAFGNTTLPDWYIKNSEPGSKAGTKMGLQVVLDAHTDLFDAFCVESEYDSFTALIIPSTDFPLTNQKGFSIKRGYNTKVAMSGIIISADDSLRDVDPFLRGCMFSNEYPLKLFKNYSQANCFFECTLKYTQKVVKNIYNMSQICTPWYYPFIDAEQLTCDPYVTKSFVDILSANVPDSECGHCLPDCNYYVYNYKLSDAPYRNCDDFNFGISPLCDFERKDPTLVPVIWGEDVINQLTERNFQGEVLPNYVKNIPTNIRQIKPLSALEGTNPPLFSTYKKYNAFERDIATVSIYFDSPTVWQFSTQASSTWIAFFGNIGGLYGLCIGLSIASIVELVWLLIRLIIEVDIIDLILSPLKHKNKARQEKSAWN